MEIKRLSTILKLIANPERMAILFLLLDGDRSITELAQALDSSPTRHRQPPRTPAHRRHHRFHALPPHHRIPPHLRRSHHHPQYPAHAQRPSRINKLFHITTSRPSETSAFRRPATFSPYRKINQSATIPPMPTGAIHRLPTQQHTRKHHENRHLERQFPQRPPAPSTKLAGRPPSRHTRLTRTQTRPRQIPGRRPANDGLALRLERPKNL